MEQSMYANWREVVTYGENGPDPQTISDDGKVRVLVGGLRAGQRIPVHPEEQAVYVFVEGAGQMFVDEDTYPVAPGVTVIVGPGAKRGMLAETQLAFVAVRVKG